MSGYPAAPIPWPYRSYLPSLPPGRNVPVPDLSLVFIDRRRDRNRPQRLCAPSLPVGDCIPSLPSCAGDADPANPSLTFPLFSLIPSEQDPKLTLIQPAPPSPASSAASTSHLAGPRLSLPAVPIVSGRSYPVISSCQSVARGWNVGTARARKGFSVGRQAQAIEAQTSIMDQLDMLTDVKVKSAASPARLDLTKRTILRTEIAQTLLRQLARRAIRKKNGKRGLLRLGGCC